MAWSGRRILFAFTELVLGRRLYASPPCFPNTQRLPTLYRTFIIITIIIIGPYQWSTTELEQAEIFFTISELSLLPKVPFIPPPPSVSDWIETLLGKGGGKRTRALRRTKRYPLCVYSSMLFFSKQSHRFFLSMCFFPPTSQT